MAKFDPSEIVNAGKAARRRLDDAEDEAMGKKKDSESEIPKKGNKDMSQADFTAPPGKRIGILRSGSN